MKHIFAVALLIFLAGCKETPAPVVQTKYVVVYDTLPDPQIAVRQKYQLPDDYKLVQDSAGKWLPIFHFANTNEDVYLDDAGLVVFFFYNKEFAHRFNSPKDAVRVIKKHWSEILADRASHQNSKK